MNIWTSPPHGFCDTNDHSSPRSTQLYPTGILQEQKSERSLCSALIHSSLLRILHRSCRAAPAVMHLTFNYCRFHGTEMGLQQSRPDKPLAVSLPRESKRENGLSAATVTRVSERGQSVPKIHGYSESRNSFLASVRNAKRLAS